MSFIKICATIPYGDFHFVQSSCDHYINLSDVIGITTLTTNNELSLQSHRMLLELCFDEQQELTTFIKNTLTDEEMRVYFDNEITYEKYKKLPSNGDTHNNFCQSLCKSENFIALIKKVFPLYQIRTVNRNDIDSAGNCGKKSSLYLVHPDQKERMQRILDGTDSPLYDIIQIMQYHPGWGSETSNASNHFQTLQKIENQTQSQ